MPNPDWSINIFDFFFAEVLEAAPNLASDLLENVARNTYAARFSQRFEPRGNVDAVAVDIVAVDDHITEVDADA